MSIYFRGSIPGKTILQDVQEKCPFSCKKLQENGHFLQILQDGFTWVWYPRKYFNMNLFQHENLSVTIAHVLLISHMNITIAPII